MRIVPSGQLFCWAYRQTRRFRKDWRCFVNDPHRLEPIAEIQEVLFINDSKATNVEAVFYALGAQEKPVIWIAGGTDKGNDYEPIRSLVEEKVKGMICLGRR